MARGQRHDADYFPFMCKEGNTMKYIESTYGNDGFAVWVKILRALTTTSYHYLNLSNRPRLMVFASTCRVSDELLLKIINDLVDLGEFDADLWRNDQLIWSDKFIESIQDAYKNRKNKIVKKEEFIRIAEGLMGKKLISAGITYGSYPQSKEEKSKEEERREEKPAGISGDGFVYEFVNAPKEASELIEKIAKFFSVTTDVMNPVYNEVNDFVAMNFHRKEYEKLVLVFQNYTEYKARSQEQIHGIARWMGTKEKFYQDGAWKTTDWIDKNKQPNERIKRISGQSSTDPGRGKDYDQEGF